MDHTYEKHLSSIEALCRVCARLTLTTKQKKYNRYRKPTSVHSVASYLTLLGFNIQQTNEGLYPSFICEKCRCKLRNFKKSCNLSHVEAFKAEFNANSVILCEFNPNQEAWK